MQAARQGLLFLPLRLRGPPVPASPGARAAPAAGSAPATRECDGRVGSGVQAAGQPVAAHQRPAPLWDLVANRPSPSPRYGPLRPRFPGDDCPYLRALLERLARRANTLTLAAVLAAALLFYILLRRWAAEGAVAVADEEEEADAIIRSSGRLPPSTRRRLLTLALQLVPRGPGGGARRPPWAWTVRHSLDGHTAAAALQPEERFIFGGRTTMLSHGRNLAGQQSSTSTSSMQRQLPGVSRREHS